MPNYTSPAEQTANDRIGRLAVALGYAVADPATETYDRRGRLAEGWTGSAEVCLEDAQACRDAGEMVHAQVRAERGLAYRGLIRGEHYDVPAPAKRGGYGSMSETDRAERNAAIDAEREAESALDRAEYRASQREGW